MSFEFREEYGNLFALNSEYVLTHCISQDCKMGAGIALSFQKQFNLRPLILDSFPEIGKAILISREDYHIFNLITKQYYWHKPTYENLQKTLDHMKIQILEHDYRKIAMPRLGCGLDRLRWIEVRERLFKTFSDLDLEILVKYI